MSWGGNSRTSDFTVKAVDKELIERLASQVRTYFKNVLPSKRLPFEEISKGEFTYYQIKFSHDYDFSDLLEAQPMRKLYPEYIFLTEFLPFYSIHIEMVVIRNTYDSYNNSSSTDIFYIVSPSISK